MATLLQLHFAFNGPFGDAMAGRAANRLLESINQEHWFSVEGMDKKVKRTTKPGGIYLSP